MTPPPTRPRSQPDRQGEGGPAGPHHAGQDCQSQAIIDIQGELDAGTGSYAEALSNQKIPKNVEKHIRSYYDQLNKGR